MEEKDTHECKNCLSEIDGKYCHFCGQRYHDHKESFGELVYEFVSDFLHFDSRFFRTVLPLIFKPGILTKSYNEGKQRSQFHPIRLYLFSSFVYFFLFFYFNNYEEKFQVENNVNPATFIADSTKQAEKNDSLILSRINTLNPIGVNKIESGALIPNPKSGINEHKILPDSNKKSALPISSYLDSLLQNRVSPQEYLNQQKLRSGKNKDGYLTRILTVKNLKINLEGEEGQKEFLKKLTETFLHNIPKMLFFLLPLFALFLKLLYFRNKQHYYVDHAILSLHYFSLIFLLLILSNFILDKIFSTDLFTKLAVGWMSVYILIAMKRIYCQSWRRTILKYVMLGLLMIFAILFTVIGNLAWSAFMV